MYDVKREKVVISRDVKFDETQGWDWKRETGSYSNQGEFVIQLDPTSSAPTVQMFESRPTDPGTPNDPNSPLQDFESQDDSHSQKSVVTGCGPMLPRLPTDSENLSDPSVAVDETVDDTPIRGWRNMDEVYDLLLTEIQELLIIEEEPNTIREAQGNKEWRQAMQDEIA